MRSNGDPEKIKAIEEAFAEFDRLCKDPKATAKLHRAFVSEKTTDWNPSGVRRLS